jgi:2-methylcitrate dehydratase PrpD
MSEQTLTGALAAFGSDASYESLPSEVRASVVSRVLDTMGVAIAAIPLETSRAVMDYCAGQSGNPQAHALGIDISLPAAQAAFVNGLLAHSLDYDDTHLPSILHPSASVIPASLAAAESAGATGKEAIRAIAVGLEVCVRLGMAGYDRSLGNSTFFERGQHATSICGAIGSATAAAILLEASVTDAIGIAVSFASGVIEANRTGGTVKRLHCGWAARSGVTAAELAGRGITGPPTALEGRFGFFQAFLSGQFDARAITDGLGTTWAAPGIFFKPYPANHFTHAGIDAAISLRQKGLSHEEIEEMTLRVPSATVRTIGEPIETKRAPETGYQAQFSGPYTVAAALLGGGGLGLGLDDFTDELARDPGRRELSSKVTVAGDRECDEIYPNQFPAILTVRTKSGSTVIEKVLANRGGPIRPLTQEELSVKFRENAARVLSEDEVSELEAAVLDLESLESLDSLFRPNRIQRR